jgi:hypothetical protein
MFSTLDSGGSWYAQCILLVIWFFITCIYVLFSCQYNLVKRLKECEGVSAKCKNNGKNLMFGTVGIWTRRIKNNNTNYNNKWLVVNITQSGSQRLPFRTKEILRLLVQMNAARLFYCYIPSVSLLVFRYLLCSLFCRETVLSSVPIFLLSPAPVF